MKFRKYDLPIMSEYFNSLNSDMLWKRLSYKKLNSYIIEMDENVCVFDKSILNLITIDELNKIMNTSQWYISKTGTTFIGYRPRNYYLKNDNIFNYKFYHFSPISNEHLILKNGIKPKTKNNLETYEPSVYLLSEFLYLKDEDNYFSLDSIIHYLIDQLREKSNTKEQYSIFEINFKNNNVNLHLDPTYEYGCFVHRTIIPSEIKLINHY